MPDPNEEILGTEGEKPTEPAKPDPVLEAIEGVKTQLSDLGSQVNDFGTRLDKIENPEPPEEETDEEHFQPKTWDEVPQKAREIATEVVEQTLEERKQAEEETKTQEAESQKKIDEFIDTQVETLEKDGAIPKVENPDDENDKGRVARRELFGLAARFGTMDLKAAHELIDVLHKGGYTYDPKANNMKGEFLRSETTPSGVFAPVASSSKSTGSVSVKPSYKEISTLPVDQLIRKVIPDYQ